MNFDIPNLQNQAQYRYRLTTRKPGDGNQGNATQETYTDVNEDVSISSNTITRGASGDASFERLTFTFNTSKHNTFVQKMNSLSATSYYTLIDGSSDVGALGIKLNDFEPFGVNDIEGSKYTDNKALIKLEGIQTDYYYTGRIYPLVYQNYPLDNDIELDRDISILGLPPVKSLRLTNAYSVYTANTPNSTYLRQNFPYRWHLAYSYKQDFSELQYKIVNRYLGGSTVSQSVYDQFGYIINGVFPYLEREFYNVKVEYVLPNQTSGNSTNIQYKNEF